VIDLIIGHNRGSRASCRLPCLNRVAKEFPLRAIAVLVVSALFAGCAASGTRNEVEPTEPTPLQLWSHHKSLDQSVAACGERAYDALKTLGFSNVVRNGDYSYGNFGDSRAAVKCVEMPKGSFVYFAVASTKKETAEVLRNRISTKF
jgi:hypothetical protein